jgi:hypothetical protein
MEKYDAGLAAIVAAQQARDAGDLSEARMKFVEGIVRISKVALLQACGSATGVYMTMRRCTACMCRPSS